MGLMADVGSPGVGGPAVGFDGSAWGDIVCDDRVQALGGIVLDGEQRDAAWAAGVHLDRAGDRHLALMAAPAAAGEGIVFCGRGFRSRRPRPGRRAGPGRARPCCGAAWRRAARRSCTTRGRAAFAAAARRCRWNGSPSGRRPRTRWSAAAWSRAGPSRRSPKSVWQAAHSRSRLWSSAHALACRRPGRRSPRASAGRRPSGAGRLVGEVVLELEQGTREIGHERVRSGVCSLFVLPRPAAPATTYCGTGRTGISL